MAEPAGAEPVQDLEEGAGQKVSRSTCTLMSIRGAHGSQSDQGITTLA